MCLCVVHYYLMSRFNCENSTQVLLSCRKQISFIKEKKHKLKIIKKVHFSLHYIEYKLHKNYKFNTLLIYHIHVHCC